MPLYIAKPLKGVQLVEPGPELDSLYLPVGYYNFAWRTKDRRFSIPVDDIHTFLWSFALIEGGVQRAMEGYAIQASRADEAPWCKDKRNQLKFEPMQLSTCPSRPNWYSLTCNWPSGPNKPPMASVSFHDYELQALRFPLKKTFFVNLTWVKHMSDQDFKDAKY